MNAMQVQTRSFFISLSLCLGNHLADFWVGCHPMSLSEVSCQSFSTSAAILAMDILAQRCPWSATSAAVANGFPSIAFLVIAHICILAKACHGGHS
jgi:hypothetical protein